MKKIIFYKAMRGGDFIPVKGYLYTHEKNGIKIDFAINKTPAGWEINDIKTGALFPFLPWKNTLKESIKAIKEKENIFDAYEKISNTLQYQTTARRLKDYRREAATCL